MFERKLTSLLNEHRIVFFFFKFASLHQPGERNSGLAKRRVVEAISFKPNRIAGIFGGIVCKSGDKFIYPLQLVVFLLRKKPAQS